MSSFVILSERVHARGAPESETMSQTADLLEA
jgi:hypothetical protein